MAKKKKAKDKKQETGNKKIEDALQKRLNVSNDPLCASQ